MTTEAYINKIMDETGLTPKEIQELVNEKKAELKGLISDEGALLIIAKELMVEIKTQEKEYLNEIDLKIKDVSVGMKNLTLTGRINEIYKIFSFSRSDGTEGQVGSFLLNDGSGAIRVVLWDDDTKILKHDNFMKNEIVKIYNAYAKKGRDGFVEVHIGKFGKINLSPEDIDYNIIPKITESYINIEKVGANLRSASIKGKVIRITPISEFKKNDGTEGKVRSMTLMDSTGTMRVVFWNEYVDKIEGIKVGENVAITQLTPRVNNLNSGKYELVANHNSTLSKNKEYVVSFKGVITSVDDLRDVTLKSNDKVPVLGFQVSDETDSIRITAWRDNAIKLSKSLQINQSVLLKDIKIRNNERFNRKEGTFLGISEISNIDDEIVVIRPNNNKFIGSSFTESQKISKIESIDNSGIFEIKGNIVKEVDLDKNELFIYDACPICSKKIINCNCDVKKEPEKRVILKVVLDDGTASIRATFFGDKAEKLLGMNASELSETLDIGMIIKRIAGKKLKVRGKAILNDYYDTNTYDFNVFDFEEIDSNQEVNRLLQEIQSSD
jgi:replication factor A1